MTKREKKRLADAMDRLASMLEYGELMAATDPSALLNAAADGLSEVATLRRLVRELYRVAYGGWLCAQPVALMREVERLGLDKVTNEQTK